MMVIFNFNVGVFGYVDSGKISLFKVLSMVESIVSFDKNFQSRECGIIFDLGFFLFFVDIFEYF